MKSLEQYFRENMARDIIDHSLRISSDEKGRLSFYVHPANADGDTLDFKLLRDNVILPIECTFEEIE